MRIVSFQGIYQTKEKQARKWDHQEDSDLEEVDVTYVKIDSKIFRFEEDPSDGYRSYCNETIVEQAPTEAVFNFENYPVLVNMLELNGESWGDEDNYDYGTVRDFRGIVIVSPRDNKTVLGTFGTDNVGDYYPGCRMWMDIPALNEHLIPDSEAGRLIYVKEN